LITGFKNIGVLFFIKKLEFNKQFIYELSGTLFDLSIAITLAFILRNVWALIWGGLAGNLIRLLMSYLLHPYRPKLKIDKSKAKDLFCFGKWIVGSGIIGFLLNQGDDIFVGKMLGVTSLGIYQMAYLLSNLPATEITHVISQVTFPAYSKLQNNIPKLRSLFLKVLRLTIFFSAPIAGGIFILIPEFIRLVMGTKWMPMVPVMQILVLAGLVRSLAATTGPIFCAVGQPEIETKWQAIRLIILAILIYPFTVHWGLIGTSIIVLINIFIATISYCVTVLRITECTSQSLMKSIILPLVNMIIMILILFFLKNQFISIQYLQLILLIGVGVVCYYLIAILFDKLLDYGITKTIKELIVT
jgi:O-antigen/teichoic acid export membrane protein